MKTILSSLAILCAPMAAMACPTGADLTSGISVTYDDGITEEHTLVKDNLVRVISYEDGARFSEFLFANGTYLLSSTDIVDGQFDIGSRMVNAFDLALSDFPQITPSMRWQATSLTNHAFNDVEVVNYVVATSAERQMEIGACRYQAIDVVIASEGDETILEGLVYLPELGMSVFSWFEDETGQRDDYAAVSISAL